MIALDRLTVAYPGAPRPAVRQLTFEAAAGEVVGFIGPNGAGKTSTLRVLAGLQAPTSGRVRIAGVDVARNPAGVRAKVGYLPDSFGVYEDLTCREYLEFFAAAQGIARPRADAIIGSVLELTDLEGKADQLAGELSRGMQQRLGLARVLVHEPDVLLLDEPASGLDPRARVEVREVLRELGAMGKTILLSSHVLADIASCCTSIAVLETGGLAYRGSVEAALRSAGVDSIVEVAALEGPEAAALALAADPSLRVEAAVNGSPMRVHVAAATTPQEAAARVARALAAAGLTPTHLAAERADLESAFLRLTEGHVA